MLTNLAYAKDRETSDRLTEMSETGTETQLLIISNRIQLLIHGCNHLRVSAPVVQFNWPAYQLQQTTE